MNWADVKPVIKATKDILGEDNIYYMVAYKPLQRSSAFRLWCKSRGYDINEYDEIAKTLAESTKKLIRSDISGSLIYYKLSII